jgi:Integrase core domain
VSTPEILIFATLECDLLGGCRFRTQAEARTMIFDFIEGFYNPRRRHSSLDYLSPIDYERRHYAMIVVPDDHQPAAVLTAVKDASRRLRQSPAAILDRPCARLAQPKIGRAPIVVINPTGLTQIPTRPPNRGRSSTWWWRSA